MASPTAPQEQTIEDVFKNPALREAFYKHLTGAYSTENLLFVEAVNALEHQAAQHKTKEFQRQLKELYETYVPLDASQQVNLPATNIPPGANNSAQYLTEKYNAGTLTIEDFSGAKREIIKLMKDNNFNQFLNERAKQSHQDIIKNFNEQSPIGAFKGRPAQEIAAFLHQHTKALDPRRVGELLGEHADICKAYMNIFVYNHTASDQGIRIYDQRDQITDPLDVLKSLFASERFLVPSGNTPYGLPKLHAILGNLAQALQKAHHLQRKYTASPSVEDYTEFLKSLCTLNIIAQDHSKPPLKKPLFLKMIPESFSMMAHSFYQTITTEPFKIQGSAQSPGFSFEQAGPFPEKTLNQLHNSTLLPKGVTISPPSLPSQNRLQRMFNKIFGSETITLVAKSKAGDPVFSIHAYQPNRFSRFLFGEKPRISIRAAGTGIVNTQLAAQFAARLQSEANLEKRPRIEGGTSFSKNAANAAYNAAYKDARSAVENAVLIGNRPRPLSFSGSAQLKPTTFTISTTLDIDTSDTSSLTSPFQQSASSEQSPPPSPSSRSRRRS